MCVFTDWKNVGASDEFCSLSSLSRGFCYGTWNYWWYVTIKNRFRRWRSVDANRCFASYTMSIYVVYTMQILIYDDIVDECQMRCDKTKRHFTNKNSLIQKVNDCCSSGGHNISGVRVVHTHTHRWLGFCLYAFLFRSPIWTNMIKMIPRCKLWIRGHFWLGRLIIFVVACRYSYWIHMISDRWLTLINGGAVDFVFH